jgi:Alpha/beta hydrolase domain
MMRRMTRRHSALILSLFTLSTVALVAAGPMVTGPVPAKAAPGDPGRDYPFFAALEDLKARGYVEQEYFFSGTANQYETPDGATGKVTDGNHKYRTRFVVRRPADAKAFNGTVIVEWNNVTSGHDLDIDWYQIHDHIIRSGYAWVGVTAQRIGVEALKVWNKDRYASLDVTDGGAITNDALSYDIFADVGRAARDPKGTGSVDFLGGLKAQRVFATGHSQSSARLATYANAIHPLDPVFDAVILHGGGGKIRTDLKIKIWKLNSETDVIIGQAAARQPDTDNFRTWEVAGDSHVDTQFVASRSKLAARDGNPIAPGFTPGLRGGTGAPAPTPAPQLAAGGNPCERPTFSDVPFHQVMAAALDHLVAWVRDGKAPPAAPPIDVTSITPVVIARDADGNSSGGGIRLAAMAVPIAVNTGQNSGPGFCRLYGSHVNFDAATLASKYPKHAAYVAAVRAVVDQNVKAGYILRRDADATIAAAETSAIGK